jgi:NADP-dependent 3-hydroxy acid dehydrogenase YdfG
VTRTQPRPIREQVVVITGASSGIGRETALRLGRGGAAVVPVARGGRALESLRDEIERLGGRAHPVVADVADWPQVEQAATAAVERFGRIDTWVNNAAVALYATVEQADVDEMRRVVDVGLMGTVHGVKAALPHLRRQGRGAIVNVASVLGTRAVPLQAAYCAAKFGVKGFTDSLRVELERTASGIAVTLILPSSVGTPLFDHARTKMGVRPRPIPPVYDVGTVADAIIFAVEHPRRDIVVGGAGKLLGVMERLSPELVDAYLLHDDAGFRQQRSQEPARPTDNLFEPVDGGGRARGRFGDRARQGSRYTQVLDQHPLRKRLLALGGAVGLALWLRRRGRRSD